MECAFCGNDVTRHDPVSVREGIEGDFQADTTFCNWACLRAYIDAEELTTGDCCRWEP
ncbi:MAG: hypothetical protein ABEI77_00780 [Halorientalis sp.]